MSTVPCKVNGKQGRYLSSTPKACACFELQLSECHTSAVQGTKKGASAAPGKLGTVLYNHRAVMARLSLMGPVIDLVDIGILKVRCTRMRTVR